jgi:hypothetical protein
MTRWHPSTAAALAGRAHAVRSPAPALRQRRSAAKDSERDESGGAEKQVSACWLFVGHVPSLIDRAFRIEGREINAP